VTKALFNKKPVHLRTGFIKYFYEDLIFKIYKPLENAQGFLPCLIYLAL